MKILVLGANGFIGQHVARYLYSQGHQIGAGCHHAFPELNIPCQNVPINFIQDTDWEVWEQRIKDYDLIINCVGILHASKKQQQTVHFIVPQLIAMACLKFHKQFIHISALGIDNVKVPYASSKKQFEQWLQLQPFDWLILRPSLVYATGSYGGTSLFRAMAALSKHILLYRPCQKFSPIAMEDLCQCISQGIQLQHWRDSIDLVGPEDKTLGEIVQAFRQWLGWKTTCIHALPKILIWPLCLLGGLIKELPINRTSMAMMAADNTANSDKMQQQLRVKPQSFDDYFARQSSAVQDRWHAKLYFFAPLLRISLALFWVLSGLIGWQVEEFMGFTNRYLMQAGCLVDIILGGALLIGWRVKKVYWVQIALMLGYMVIFSILAPQLWLDPIGGLLKNIPIILLTLIALILSDPR